MQIRIDEYLICTFLPQTFDVFAPGSGLNEFGRVFGAKPAGSIVHTLESHCESWVLR